MDCCLDLAGTKKWICYLQGFRFSVSMLWTPLLKSKSLFRFTRYKHAANSNPLCRNNNNLKHQKAQTNSAKRSSYPVSVLALEITSKPWLIPAFLFLCEDWSLTCSKHTHPRVKIWHKFGLQICGGWDGVFCQKKTQNQLCFVMSVTSPAWIL